MKIQAIGTVLVVALAGAAASAQTYNFPLSGLQEVPANASPAVGQGTLIVNPVTFEYSLTVVYSGLTTPISAAHFHRAAFGVNGPVIINLGPQASPIINNGTFTASQYADLLDELLYINIHTSTFPGGEIRGQIVPAPAGFAALAMAGLVAARRRRG